MKIFFKSGSVVALLVAAALIAGGFTAQAQSENGSSTLQQLQEQIQQLQEQVVELRARIQSQNGGDNSSDTVEPVEMSDPLVMMEDDDDDDIDADELEIGDRGERVRQLQELLAQDASIYPEGLATGYYGNLTSQAVARLQQRIGIPDDGEFNDETMSRIRDLIENGAGNSGITPPGLITAPGIQRLLGADESDDSDDDDNNDDSDDSDEVDDDDRRRGPNFDNLSIPEELKERLRAIFNRFDDDDDDDESDAEEEIADAEEEIARAEEEIAEEKEEGGETEAAEARLKEARDKLDEAKTALSEGREDEAEELAEEAEDFAGEARMKYLGKTADEISDDDELEIEAEAEDGETEVKIEYADGSEEEFVFDTTDRDEVIARLVEETDLTEEEIEAVLEFEIEDEDEDEDDDNDDDDDEDDEN